MKAVCIGFIKIYQLVFRHLPVSRCRFYPSCSAYAIEGIEKFGVIRGCSLFAKRFAKCHPFHPGGHDPVP